MWDLNWLFQFLQKTSWLGENPKILASYYVPCKHRPGLILIRPISDLSPLSPNYLSSEHFVSANANAERRMRSFWLLFKDSANSRNFSLQNFPSLSLKLAGKRNLAFDVFQYHDICVFNRNLIAKPIREEQQLQCKYHLLGPNWCKSIQINSLKSVARG